jgi:hypothetical protein
MADALATE